MTAALYQGVVTHRRLRPVRHAFRYRVLSLLVDIDRIGEETRGARLLSHNRPNLFAIQDRDLGPGDGAPLRPWVLARLDAGGVPGPIGRIELLTFPRVLGYAFAPLSLYFAHDARGRLVGVVYEVHNTFGERHAYALPAAGGPTVDNGTRKALHVSPFMAMDCRYAFRLRPPGARFALAIRQSDGTGELFRATHAARRRPLSDTALLGAAIRFPLMGVGVMAAILWEALRLRLKGTPVYPHPRKSGAEGTPATSG